MGKKGLCDTCENDRGCVFQNSFPILQCEEFTILNHKVTRQAHLKPKKTRCLQEAVTEE